MPYPKSATGLSIPNLVVSTVNSCEKDGRRRRMNCIFDTELPLVGLLIFLFKRMLLHYMFGWKQWVCSMYIEKSREQKVNRTNIHCQSILDVHFEFQWFFQPRIFKMSKGMQIAILHYLKRRPVSGVI